MFLQARFTGFRTQTGEVCRRAQACRCRERPRRHGTHCTECYHPRIEQAARVLTTPNGPAQASGVCSPHSTTSSRMRSSDEGTSTTEKAKLDASYAETRVFGLSTPTQASAASPKLPPPPPPYAAYWMQPVLAQAAQTDSACFTELLSAAPLSRNTPFDDAQHVVILLLELVTFLSIRSSFTFLEIPNCTSNC